MEKVLIFDTTLRDGEQAAGGSLTVEEKVAVAKQLEKLKVDVIEAGFPASSKGDFKAVSLISEEVREPVICALARANLKDIERAWEAVKGAESPRIHIFLSTSRIHQEYQLKMTPERIMDLAAEAVRRAKKLVSDVEFSPMDATRTDHAFLYKILEAVIDEGATTVNIPDTVGYALPAEFGSLISGVLRIVPNISKATVSVHCHDDLGLATANTIEAVAQGARQVECTINGIGERAGNAALEEIVMALKTRNKIFPLLETGVDTVQIYNTSKLISELTGFRVQVNKAIVGDNAFRHESGIHQDGILKNRGTYEIIDPKDVGVPETSLSIGKLSGSHALRERLKELGYELKEERFLLVFKAFKELADKKKNVTDRDIESLVAEEQRTESGSYVLERIRAVSGDGDAAVASVVIKTNEGNVFSGISKGSGPVDAAYKAIDTIVKIPNVLKEYAVDSITEGIDAIGSVLVRIESNGRTYTGRGADTDIICASAKAYVNALNRITSES